jgi:hypothetical protein
MFGARLALVLVLAAAFAGGAPRLVHAADRVRDCPAITDRHPGLAALATVLNVRNMTCAQARRIVHRYGPKVDSGSQFRLRGRFRLGRFACRVYFVDYEDHKARCAAGRRAFRFDYGS